MNDMTELHALLTASYDVDSAITHKRLATRASGLKANCPFITVQQTNADVLEFFVDHKAQENVAVVKDGLPLGLINKNIFMEAYAKPFAREVFGKRPCTEWMNRTPLVVDENTTVETLTKLAVDTGESVLRDGFITTDEGVYSGIGSGFSLMQAMSDLEAEKTRQLLDSIHYASTIQEAHLRSSKEHLVLAFADQYMLWQPRDVVGGDCYFVRRFDHGVLFAVIDCTGHGVPGAFMTLIALSWLEQVSSESRGEPVPGELLAGLNRYIKRVLDQGAAQKPSSQLQAGASDSDDGMDIAAVWLPDTGDRLFFSSAHLSLMLVEPGSQEVMVIDGDKAGVGYSTTPDNHVWPTHELPLLSTQRALIVTDGVIDQLGGAKRIALGKKRIMQFLGEHSHLPAAQIGPILKTFISDWQGPQLRRDDVTAFCFTTGVQS